MYSVSNDYLTKMFDQVQTHRLKGTINGTPFSGDDVIGVSYTNQCTEKKVKIGSVFTGTLKLTFLNGFLSRGDYFKKPITISDGLLLGYDDDDEPIWEDIPLGTFYIMEATWRAEGMVDIIAYDCLSLLDTACPIDSSNGTIYSFCKFIELETGVTFGMTEAQCLELPNGSETISVYPENDIVTYRDLLSYLAAFAGGFAYAGRDNKFYIKNFTRPSILTIPKNRRMSSAKYSDFETAYDAIAYTYLKTGQISYFGPGNWSIIDLGANPFLQYGSADALYRRRYAILGAIVRMIYTPYTVSLLPAFICLDLADVISFSDDYTEDTTSGAVMQITWTYNKSVTVSCFGDNPNLDKVKSSTNKSISSLTRSSSQNEMAYYNYANTEAVTFGPETETTIAKLRFMGFKVTNVLIFHEFIFDMELDPSVINGFEVHYYLDGERVTYTPYESLSALGVKTDVGGTEYDGVLDTVEASITRDFFYMVKGVTGNTSHLWEVRILTHGVSSTTFDVDHVHVTLEGQGLYGGDMFEGFIEAEDTLALIDIGHMDVLDMSDDAEVTEEWTGNFLITDNDEIFITDDGDGIILND